MSISPTFYEQPFSYESLLEDFIVLEVLLLTFWYKKIGGKAALKILVLLTTWTKLFRTRGFFSLSWVQVPAEQ